MADEAQEQLDYGGDGSAEYQHEGEAAGAEDAGNGEGGDGSAAGGAGVGDAAGDDDIAEMQRMMAQLEEQNNNLGSAAAAASAEAASAVASKADAQKAALERDERSVFVGGVDFSTTAAQLAEHFSTCGVVERVTLLTDRSGHPKG